MCLWNYCALPCLGRDVVDDLVERGTTNANDFAWMSQMRFYYDERDGGSLEMRLLQARVSYAFEYLGNATRLVITPLTERCFRCGVRFHL